MEQYDLVIVGAGSGNTILDPAFDDWSVAIVEEWVFGGTCLTRGCIPTKILVHTADTALAISDADRFGLDARLDKVRWTEIRDRVFGRIDPIADSGERYRKFDCPNVTVHSGHGRFVGPRQMEVTTPDRVVVIEGRAVVVAAGSRPMVPGIPGLSDVDYYTSDDVMRIDEVPEHLIVIGGGFVACELAHVFGALGAEVTILQRGLRLLQHEDHDISAALTTDFAQRFDLRCASTIDRVHREGDGVTVVLNDGTSVTGSHLLVATGRIPNSDLLDAAAGGLDLHADGRIAVDTTHATSVPGVWALGDISSPYMLKHVANHEARVVAHNLLHPDAPRHSDYRAVPHAVFTHPQIAGVGMTEMEALAAGIDVMVSAHRYSDVAFGWALEDTTSFCKLIADRASRLLVGAHIIGPHSSSMIQQLVQGLQFGQTIDDMANGQYYIHPALGEVVENALLAFPPA